MRRFAFSLVLMIFMVSSVALVQASSMDISDPTCVEGCVVLNSTSFSFFADSTGGGILTFQNGTTQDWTSLSITETGIAASDIHLATNLFTNTLVTDLGNNSALLQFFGIAGDCADDLNGLPDTDDANLSETCGIAVDQIFVVNLNDPGSSTGSWVPNMRFDAVAGVPEPASLLLMGVGLAGILGLKKKQRS